MRKLEIDLRDILDLVNCAEDYGHGNSVLLTTFGEFTGPVTDAEIAEFASSMGAEYGDEGREEATTRLTYWRDRYARGAG